MSSYDDDKVYEAYERSREQREAREATAIAQVALLLAVGTWLFNKGREYYLSRKNKSNVS